MPVEPFEVTRFQRDLSEPFMHTGFAPRLTAVRTVKEVPHRLCEIPQRLLLHCLTSRTEPRILRPGLGQLRGLLYVTRSLPTRLPMPLLLDRQIPHIPRISAVRQQGILLLRGRQQPEPRHIRTVTTATDISSVSALPRYGP